MAVQEISSNDCSSGQRVRQEPDREHNLATHLRHWAQQQPQKPAVIFVARRQVDGRPVYATRTYADLEALTDAYAHGLAAAGVQQGVRTLLFVRPGLDLLLIALALLKIGALPIFIDPMVGFRRLLTCVAEAQPQAVIGIPLVHALRLAAPRAFRSVRTWITVARRWPGRFGLPQMNRPQPQPFPLASVAPHDPVAVTYTTGSTGLPKGAIYTTSMFAALLAQLGDLFGARADDIDLAAFPLFALFDILLGLTAALPDLDVTRPAQVNPARLVQMIHDQRVTLAFGSPALWEPVTRYCQAQQITLPTLRRVLMAGAPVRASLLARFRGLLAPGGDTCTPYGATEALTMTAPLGAEILAARAARPEPIHGTCVGRPAPGIELAIIRITDAPLAAWDQALRLPPGQAGEIVVRGPAVSVAYFQRPQADRLAKIPAAEGTWHRTGDVGYLDEQGRVWFCGRKADRLEWPAGSPLFSDPVENVFNQHPRVYRSALVPGPPDRDAPAGGPQPVIVIEPLPGHFPRTVQAHAQFVAELRTLGVRFVLTSRLTSFAFHPGFPVDRRHNAKIFRDRLARWVARRPFAITRS